MLRGDQRILPHDVEFIKLNVVQEHIDAAEVVDGQVDLLPEKAPLDVVLAQHLSTFSSNEPELQAGWS